MKLKILEPIEYFHADQIENNNTPFSSEDYQEAIVELENLVNERNKFANMGMAAPFIPAETNEEPLGSRILLLSSRLLSSCIFPLVDSKKITDDAILELRLSLGSNLKKDLINDN